MNQSLARTDGSADGSSPDGRAILNSTWASLLGEVNAAARVAYALGRIRLLPPAAASVHPKRRTPWIAAIALAVVGIAVALGFGFGMSAPRPLGAVLFLGALVTILFVPIYILTALSCPFYDLRLRRNEFNLLLHGVIPVVGAAFFVPVFLGALGINFGGLGIAPLGGPARFTPWIALGWLALGVVVLAVLRRSRAESLRQLDRVFIHDEGPDSA